MKKVFTEELPHKRKNIDWKISIGYKVKFIYDDIHGEIEIVNYYIKENNKPVIDIKYNNKIIYNVSTDNFSRCQIGKLLKIYKKNFISSYKYQIGDIFNNLKSGKLQILERIRVPNGRTTRKGYRYKCLICGNEDVISERDLDMNNGCNVCCEPSQKVLIGYNDIWTTNPELAKLLANSNDGYKYTQNANQYVDWKCLNCNNIIKHKLINQINKEGLSCPNCSDGIPYTEKFMYQVLKQLFKCSFIYQLSKTTFKWCKNYLYDFYFEVNNNQYIIGVNGIQHYEESFKQIKKARTLKEEQENDRLKKELALQNGILEDNYIVIDCRESTLAWIKNHILKSKLNELFDLNNINWLKCHEYACNSLVKQTCDLWNNGNSIIQISDKLKLGKNVIRKYLKRGEKIKWCNYSPKEEMIKQYNNFKRNNSKKIICLNDNNVFNSIKDASKYYNLNSISDIGKCCQYKLNYAEINKETGEKFQWQYYEEYLINPRKLLTNEEINKISKNKKPIICLNNKKIFNSITEAQQYYNINNISENCKEKNNYSGVDPKTGEYLQWQYYNEYLIKPKKLLSNNEIDKIKNDKMYIKNKKKVICLNNKRVFNSITEASKHYNIKSNTGIIKCCQDKYNYCGKDSITGEKLKWMYYDDYLKQQSQQDQKAI